MTFKRTATKVVKITSELPKIVVTQVGKPAKLPVDNVTPIPNARAVPTTPVFRGVISCEAIIRIPVIEIEAKTEIVAPPITA